MKSLAVLLIVLPISLAVGGCATHPTNPYTMADGVERNQVLAQKLHEQAVGVIDDDPKEAERLEREALAADLYHGPAHNNLGTLLLRQGKLYEASEEFEWARKLLPGHPNPRMNLALTLEIAGRSDEAIATYKTALEVYPEHIPSVEALARIQVRTFKTDEQTGELLKTIALRGETQQWREWARLEMARRDLRPQ